MAKVTFGCDVNSNLKKKPANGYAGKSEQASISSEYSEDEAEELSSAEYTKKKSFVETVKKQLFTEDCNKVYKNDYNEDSFIAKSLNFIPWTKLQLLIDVRLKEYIREIYIRYLSLSQDDRDNSKTSYTYADSWSYNSANRSWDWIVPNMSRMSVSSFKRKSQQQQEIQTSNSEMNSVHNSFNASSNNTAAFAVPSTPIRAVKRNLWNSNDVRESPFTRSQCRGDNFCKAGCEVHQAVRRRNTHNDQTVAVIADRGLEPPTEEDNPDDVNELVEHSSKHSCFHHSVDEYHLENNQNECLEQKASFQRLSKEKNGAYFARSMKKRTVKIRQAIGIHTSWLKLALVGIFLMCLLSPIIYNLTKDYIPSHMSSHQSSATVSSPHHIESSQIHNRAISEDRFHKMEERIEQLFLELQTVKQEIKVSQPDHSSLHSNSDFSIVEDLNDKLKNCCRNESELIAFMKEALLTILFTTESESSSHRHALSLLKGFIRSESAEVSELYKTMYNALKAELGETKSNVDVVKEEFESFKKETQSSLTDLSTNSKRDEKSDVTISDVKQLIRDALFVYDADKTGLPDYALESSGGTVVDIRCSDTFDPHGIHYKVFGIPVWSTSNSPRAVIQAAITPGDCWAFRGSEGYLVVKLSITIVPTSFSYEHIPKQISRDGNINSAPREFQVRGLHDENDHQGELLGSYVYDDNGPPLQNFPVKDPLPKPYQFIELIVMSNYGHEEYTCLYRFRVHGKPIRF